ncbi:MAG: hypothetical protein IKY26_00220 [Erysipelotrichaceae bacterium]|nr:hypothetical protein [Erysipelotrichaceae bacterium]
MATYNELATNYANQKKQEYEQSLGYLTEGLNKQQTLDQTALQQRYDNLLNQINQQITPVTEQYNKNAQAAYINKMLSGQALNTQLSQLGVDTQGFGVAQRLANETAYGQNLAGLQSSRDESLRDISNQATNAMGELTAEQTALDSKYAGLLNDMNKYIQEQVLAYGENEYAKYLENLKYEEELKQIAWEQAFKEKQLAEQIRQFNEQAALERASLYSNSSGGGGSFDDVSGTPAQSTQKQFGKLVLAAQQKYGTFSNGYQPKGIIYDNGNKSVDYGKVTDSGARQYVNGKLQTVWKTSNGQRWVWDGSIGQYIKLK